MDCSTPANATYQGGDQCFRSKRLGSSEKERLRRDQRKLDELQLRRLPGKDLESFYEGKVLDVLAKAKVHDHLAERQELESGRASIKKGEVLSLPDSKQ